MVRLRFDVDPHGFFEVFRKAHDAAQLYDEEQRGGGAVDAALLDATELVEAFSIHHDLARTAGRCDVCEVSHIRGGDAASVGRIGVTTYTVPLTIIQPARHRPAVLKVARGR